jgi:glycosyltransferase involved in cell wall biosynthesis
LEKREKNKALRKEAEPLITHVIAVSNTILQAHVKDNFPLPNAVVIPNCLSDPFDSHSPSPSTKSRTLNIVSVGRVSIAKGSDTLLQAFHELIQEKSKTEIKLYFIGKPDPEFNIDKNDQIEVVGEVHDKSKLLKYYQDSSIFVSASRAEGFSNVLLEAMSQGCCCVVSDLPVHIEVLSNPKPQFVFKTGDAKDLAEKLKNILLCIQEAECLWVQEEQNRVQQVSKAFHSKKLKEKVLEYYDKATQYHDSL